MFDVIKTQMQTGKAMFELDDKLLTALFAPAVKEGVFEPIDTDWTNINRWDNVDLFIRQLLELSEFYQKITAVS